MDLAISALIILVLIFTVTFTMLDVSRNMTIQQDIFTSLRSANQNALLDIKEDYESRDEITEARMIQEWLVNFLDNNNLNYRDVTLKFTYLSTDPPTYTVEVEGYSEHAYIKVTGKEAKIKYINAATILTIDDEGEGD